MAVMREWRCAAHGAFESKTGRCPKGCSKRFVQQEFRTPPAYVSNRTRHQDATTRQFAKDFGLPDVKTSDDGNSVMQNLRKNPSFAPSWGSVPHAKPGFSQRGETAPTFDPRGMGVAPEAVSLNGLAPPKPKYLHPPQPGNKL